MLGNAPLVQVNTVSCAVLVNAAPGLTPPQPVPESGPDFIRRQLAYAHPLLAPLSPLSAVSLVFLCFLCFCLFV